MPSFVPNKHADADFICLTDLPNGWEAKQDISSEDFHLRLHKVTNDHRTIDGAKLNLSGNEEDICHLSHGPEQACEK